MKKLDIFLFLFTIEGYKCLRKMAKHYGKTQPYSYVLQLDLEYLLASLHSVVYGTAPTLLEILQQQFFGTKRYPFITFRKSIFTKVTAPSYTA